MMEYEIVNLYDFCLTPNICMLKPIVLDGHNYSLILELEKTYVVPCTIIRLMNRICASLGTKLDATLEYSNGIFKNVHLKNSREENMIKLPIVLSLINQFYIFFPTASPKKKHNSWILWQNFRGHSIIGDHDGIGLHFKNDVYTEEQISFVTLSRQQYYASILYFRHMDDILRKHHPLELLFTARTDLFLAP